VLVGTDQHGNKYFEKRDAQLGELPRWCGRRASTGRDRRPLLLCTAWLRHALKGHRQQAVVLSVDFTR
jgi:hypothetical protein